LQEVAILNISNATEEVVGKQMTTVVTITNIEKHETSWMQKKKQPETRTGIPVGEIAMKPVHVVRR